MSTFRYVRFTITVTGNSGNIFLSTAFIARPKNYGILS